MFVEKLKNIVDKLSLCFAFWEFVLNTGQYYTETYQNY